MIVESHVSSRPCPRGTVLKASEDSQNRSPWMGARPYRFVLLCLLGLALFGSGYALATRRATPPAGWPFSIPIHASAADSMESLSIATGQVADDIEGLFALDGLSGDLQCTVYNPNTSAFNAVYRKNVVADLQLGATKNPRFLMVTGEVMGTRRGTRQFAASICYVVEANSGRFAAYAVPWRRDLFISGQPQGGELILLYAGSIRTAAVRE